MKASLAPNSQNPYLVCDECYAKLNTAWESKNLQSSKNLNGNPHQLSSEATERENTVKNLRVRLSRLLTVESFKPEGKHSRSNSRFPLHHSGNLSLSGINFVGNSKELISSFNPTSMTSPLSSGPNSPHLTNRLATSGLTSPNSACTYESNKNLPVTDVSYFQNAVSCFVEPVL